MRTLRWLLALAVLAGIAAVPAAFGHGSDATFSVTSSLDGKKVLPIRSHWLGYTSLPPAQVDRVEFVIDGTVRWIEHQAPYNYAADDNGKNMGFFITTWLSPGLHHFAVRVFDKTGHSEKDAFTARVVAAPAPPPALAGKTWTHYLPKGGARGGPPSGNWLLFFDRIGEWHLDPGGGGVVNQFDIRGHTLDIYAPVVMGVEQIDNAGCKGNGCKRIMRDGHSHLIYGNDCNYSGPFGSYHWSASGNELTLKPIHEGCPDRGSILTGTWTRTG